MRIRVLPIALSVALGMGFFVSSAPAQLPGFCGAICTCGQTCLTPCRLTPIGHPDPEIITCLDWGVCQGLCDNGECNTFDCIPINGTANGDTITGTSAAECIDGKGGDDLLSGNSGNDCLWGGNGNDSLDGGSGFDFGDGGAGTDTCVSVEDVINCP